MLTSVAALLEMIKEMRFGNKKGAAFGCYGWHAESTKLIEEELKKAGFEIIGERLNANWNPDDAAQNACVEYGMQLASKI